MDNETFDIREVDRADIETARDALVSVILYTNVYGLEDMGTLHAQEPNPHHRDRSREKEILQLCEST